MNAFSLGAAQMESDRETARGFTLKLMHIYTPQLRQFTLNGV